MVYLGLRQRVSRVSNGAHGSSVDKYFSLLVNKKISKDLIYMLAAPFLTDVNE